MPFLPIHTVNLTFTFQPMPWQKNCFVISLAALLFALVFSYVSSYSLHMVTLEGYFAIVHPLQCARKLTVRQILSLIGLILVLSFLFNLPTVFTSKPSDKPNVLNLAPRCTILMMHSQFSLIYGSQLVASAT